MWVPFVWWKTRVGFCFVLFCFFLTGGSQYLILITYIVIRDVESGSGKPNNLNKTHWRREVNKCGKGKNRTINEQTQPQRCLSPAPQNHACFQGSSNIWNPNIPRVASLGRLYTADYLAPGRHTIDTRRPPLALWDTEIFLILRISFCSWLW